MFRAVRAPSEPSYGASLSEFGYHMNEKGEFVNTETGEYFDFFHTDSERVNDLRRGAFQDCLRTEIAATLKDKHCIEELFLSGKDGTTYTTARPTEPHVSILVTELSKLREKRDIVLVVGESTQDCGIWAWRLVQREGGMEEGSLVGLAEKIAVRAGVDEIPGLVVLNPGQLLFSSALKNMTMASWLSRRRPNAISEPYMISRKHNFARGHEDATRHVHTVLQKVLPQIISKEARLHIITVGDGSTSTIEVLDRASPKQSATPDVGGVPESIALIEPRHEHEAISGGVSKTLLAAVGKSWVQSEEAKGTKLQLPDGPLLGMPALEFAPGAEASDVRSSIGNVGSDDQDDLSEASTIIAGPPKLEDLKISKDSILEKENIDPKDSAQFHASTQDYEAHTAIRAPPDAAAINSPPPMEVPPNTPIDSPPALALSATDEKVAGEKVVKEKAVQDYDEDDSPGLPPTPVSCPTFSAGVCDGIVETVFPAVMDDVLEHLWFYIKQARQIDAVASEKGKAWPRDGGDH